MPDWAAKALRRRERRAARFDATLVAAGALPPVMCFCVVPYTAGHGPVHAGDLIVPWLLPAAWAAVWSLLLACVELDGSPSWGERRQSLRRVRLDGRPVTRRDWLRRHWPGLWLLGGCAVLIVVYTATHPTAAGYDPAYIEVMRRATFCVALVTVIPPALAAAWRPSRGDGTVLVAHPIIPRPPRPRPPPTRPRPERRGFEVVIDRSPAGPAGSP